MPETSLQSPIVHLDGYFDNALGDFEIENSVLAAAGLTLCAPRQDVWEAASQARVVLFRAEKMDAEAITRLRHCRTLIRYGIGLDKVDIFEATKRGIAVCNAPDFCTDEMADHTVAMALSLHRKLSLFQRAAATTDWQKPPEIIRGLQDALFVTIGYGRIAKAVLQRAAAFGCQVGAVDPFVPDEALRAAKVIPLGIEEALAQADILSLHCPLTSSSARMINLDSLARMKSNCILLNTSRGGLIDTPALVSALQARTISGAGLDVTDPEPLPTEHPLHSLDNALITPHIAWYSENSERKLRRLVAEEALRAIQGEALRNQINR